MSPGTGRSPDAERIARERGTGPGLLQRFPGIAYQAQLRSGGRALIMAVGRCEEILGRPAETLVEEGFVLDGLIHPDDLERATGAVRAAAEAGDPFQVEFRLCPESAPERWVVDSGHAVLDEAGEVMAVEGFLTDVTRLKELEDRVLRSQRMEAVGELAGAIAHDFNNFLTAVLTPLDLALLDGVEDPGLKERLEGARDAARRGAGLSRQLLAYSRHQVHSVRVLDLQDFLRGMGGLIHQLPGSSIRVLMEEQGEPATVEVDPGHLEQVVLNLLVNARDAMPAGGRLTLRVSSRRVARPRLVDSGEVAPGEWVVLAVRDSGEGIPPAVRERIFEPYFTTKDEGTGLGLATVYGIVKQHGGEIQVESEPGAGTTFSIWLPRARKEPTEERARGTVRLDGPAGRVGGVALVVDDDDAVRRCVTAALVRAGYEVVEASDLESALAREKEAGEALDVLVTDVRLPGADGGEVARRLSERRPDLRVLFTSGYAAEELSQVRGGSWHFLPKPFAVEDLFAKLEEVLRAPPFTEAREGRASAGG